MKWNIFSADKFPLTARAESLQQLSSYSGSHRSERAWALSQYFSEIERCFSVSASRSTKLSCHCKKYQRVLVWWMDFLINIWEAIPTIWGKEIPEVFSQFFQTISMNFRCEICQTADLFIKSKTPTEISIAVQSSTYLIILCSL